MAQQAGLDNSQTILAWLTQRDPSIVPVIGISDRRHIDSAITAITTPLQPEQLAALDISRRNRE